MNNKLWILILIALITSLGLMATDIYTPALPAVALNMLTSPHYAQLTITLFLITTGISQLIYGPLSDHWGRRPLLIFGLAIYTCGAFLCAFAAHMPLLLTGRFIQGLGAGAIMALNRVIVRDLFSGVHLAKALSYIGAFIALAPAIAPALGGFIESHWGWRWIFGFLLVYGLILSITVWFFLPESHHAKSTMPLSISSIMRNYTVIIKNRPFWANTWCSGIALATMITCVTINPFILETTLHKTAAEYGFWALVGSVGFLAGMLLNHHVVKRLGTTRTIITGNLLILLMSLAFIITSSLGIITVSAIIIPTIGINFGVALIFPNAFVGAIAPFPKMTGAVAALYGCLQINISFFASMIVAGLKETSQLPMGILLMCSAILSLLIYQWLNPRDEEEPNLIIASD